MINKEKYNLKLTKRLDPTNYSYVRLPWCLRGKESACNAGDGGSLPGLGRFPGEGNGNPCQYSCQGNPMDRGTCPWL